MATFDPRTELLLDGVWTDITSSVYQRDAMEIARGRSDESSTVDPSRCSLTLDNRSGDFSPRNPVGSHYGVIGRNTQLRVLNPAGLPNYMVLPGGPELPGVFVSHAFSFDGGALDITGDIDIRIDIEPETWRPPDTFLTFDDVGLARKYQTDLDERSWALLLKTDGTLEFTWSDDGTDTGETTVTSTVAVPAASTRLAVRVTLDVNNGAAGNDVKFYTAPTIDDSWTQLGATVTTAGVTSIFSSGADVEIGRTDADDAFGVPGSPLQGRVYAFELRDGIGGTLRAKPDFRLQDSGTTEFQDAQGIPWELRGQATIANPNARFHGEVSSWPQRWDISGNDIYAPLQAYGIMRRLGQGATPLRSSLFRDLSTRDEVVAYWPLEEPKGAGRFAAGRAGDISYLQSVAFPAPPPSSEVTAAADADSFPASAPLPTVKAAAIAGGVPAYAGTADQRFTVLVSIPEDVTWASEKLLMSLGTTGTIRRWDFSVTTTGTVRVQAFDQDGVEIDNSVEALDMIGRPSALSLRLSQIGADLSWTISQFPLGADNPIVGGAVILGETYGRFSSVALGSSADMEDTAFGHPFILDFDVSLIWDIIGTTMLGWAGESAPDRIVRLCHQEGIPVTIVGDASHATLLGTQPRVTLLEALREAAEADLGILYEPREFLGLAYRTRASLYAQDADLALDYAAGDLFSIEPVEDDQATRNDITVKRDGGSSARVELTSGPLSVNAPPAGVGRYDDEVTISLSTDGALEDQAGWRLHLGTVDEARYPVLGINLATETFAGDAARTAEALALDLGDKVTVTSLPAGQPPDDVSQLVQGLTETPTGFQWRIAANCSPGSPWDVGVYDEDEGPGEARYSSDGSTLNEALTTTETDVDVATPSGPLWGDTDAPFDIVIGGERMTVTAVAGASSPQVFTVVRSVNEVIKTHASGAEVALFKPTTYAI